MKTLNQIKPLLKSEVPELEDNTPQEKQAFSHVPDHKKHLSQIAFAWMNNPANTQAREALANSQHVLSPQQREQLLQRLAQKTEVRINPKTKNREFLLHRGVSTEEKNNSIQNNTVYHPTASSWTPHYHIAHAFAMENLSNERALAGGDRSNIINESHNNVISAWVP
jgi:hypothetical protein